MTASIYIPDDIEQLKRIAELALQLEPEKLNATDSG